MFTSQRKNYILKKIFKDRHVSVKDLAEKLNVSFETIRRDLKEFEDKGFLVKTHGGGTLSQNINTNIPTNIRKDLYLNEKNIIAQRATKLITSGLSIFLDSSTTSLAIAQNLIAFENLMIFTNSLLIARTISEQNQHKLIVIGGNYNKINESFVGEPALNFIKNFFIDLAFISPVGISEKGIITDSSEEESAIRKQIIKNSKQTFLVMDKTKFFRTSTFVTANLNDLDGLISNAPISKKLKMHITNKKVKLIDK